MTNRINGIECMSLKSYSELKGISLSRVSQLKATLPIVEFEDINQPFINISALDLQDEVVKAAPLDFTTREPLTTLSLPQLGDYFQALIARLTKQKTSADQLREQAEENLRRAQQQTQNLQQEYAELEQNLALAQAEIVTLTDRNELQHESHREYHQIVTGEQQQLNEQIKQLVSENAGLKLAVKTLEGVFAHHSKPGNDSPELEIRKPPRSRTNKKMDDDEF